MSIPQTLTRPKRRRPQQSPAPGVDLQKKAKTKEAESESDQDEEYDNEAQDVEQKAESDDEIDEDARPKVTFIPLPKMRDTGGIEYADDRLHPNTLAFLSDLKANNKRTWLKGTRIPPSLLPIPTNKPQPTTKNTAAPSKTGKPT